MKPFHREVPKSRLLSGAALVPSARVQRSSRGFVLFTLIILAATLTVTSGRSGAEPLDRAGALPVIVVVRHANKAPEPLDDPPLTAEGAKRAQDLATALLSAGVTGIITTQLRRTRETGVPLA